MNWRSTTVERLVDSIGPTVPAAAMIAAVAVDEDGYAVRLSDSCPLNGRFEIGSVTKTMTGIVLASLVNDGTVTLDDRIGKWLDAGQNSEITLGQLATHTSGLPRLSPRHRTGAADPYAFLTAQVAERELRSAEPKERGVEWDYSNFGFQVLGLALERAGGAQFEALLEEHIFQPLDMTCSGIPGRGGGIRLQGHSQGEPVAPWSHHLWGAGGVEASAEDMARYLSACLMPPDSPVGQAIRATRQSHHQIDPLRSAGLGWALGPPGYLGHDGGTSGFRVMLGLKPDEAHAAGVLVSDKSVPGLARAVRLSLDRDV